MPSPKKSKKKSQVDDKQKSLFSFVDESKPKKEKVEPKPKKEEVKKEVQERPKEKIKEIKKEIVKKAEPKGEKKPRVIPQKIYFKGNDKPFGLKVGDIKLTKGLRESVSSTYIRYLIEKGDIIQNLERGLLLDVDYDGGQNKAYCKFYDLDSDEIKIWIDTTNHEPYCLSKDTIENLKKIKYHEEIEVNGEKRKIWKSLTEFQGFNRFKEEKRFELLSDKEIKITKVYGKTPLDIGGSGLNIKNILEPPKKDEIEEEKELKVWEADIRYHLNFIFDRQLIPGLIYSIENGAIKKVKYKESDDNSKKVADELRDLFKDEKSEMQEFSEKFLDIFLTPIPDVKRLAMDIEVNIGEHDYTIPNPREAKQKIISISFATTDGLKLVYILDREGYTYNKLHEDFPSDAQLIFFKTEKELLTETFRLMWEYPIVITFNGDNFDLNYMFHRANRLRIDKDLNPIHVKRGFGIMSSADCDLRKGIHIDVFNFFFNRSISGYAFGGAYESNSLNSISAGLLGAEKYQHEEEIHEMEYDILSWYNLKDSLLTLELTTFNNSLVWNLIILLCRITKMPIHEMIRRQISTWIQNIFYFEHRRRNFLIPRKAEISKAKKGGYKKSIIAGKTFQGAYVKPPVPGIHYDVVVMDFASLYPSIIKESNLSYETIRCPHEDCKDNFLSGINYYTCTHKMGVFAYVVGFFRDIRVKFFKPKSSDKTLSQKQRDYYQTIQQALKVFVNSAYGVFGSLNFPLFCLPVAESTTAIGQYAIKQTIKKSEEIGVKVLYGDTDSVFLLNPSKEQMNNLSNWSRRNLNLDLEEEKTYQFLALSGRKKNYLGVYKDSKFVDTKGLVVKKKNTAGFIKKVFEDLLKNLKNVSNNDEFLQAKKNIIKIVKENLNKIGNSNAFRIEDYAINITLQKNINNYIKVIPQHVKAAKIPFEEDMKKVTKIRKESESKKKEGLNLEAKNLRKEAKDLEKAINQKYGKGATISFIKSKGSTGVKLVGEARYQDIDTKKYKDLLKSALEQVLDALGITFEEVKGIKKMDAFF